MEQRKMKVVAVKGFTVPIVNDDGMTVMERYVGYDKDGKTILAEPVEVPMTAYYIRRVNRGELKEWTPPTSSPKSAPPPPVPSSLKEEELPKPPPPPGTDRSRR